MLGIPLGLIGVPCGCQSFGTAELSPARDSGGPQQGADDDAAHDAGVGPNAEGGEPATVHGASCHAILSAKPDSSSGIYRIAPTHNDNEAFETYCDMITAGGGWTRVTPAVAPTIVDLLKAS